jgi:uncharacterized protein with GYD domain
MLAAVLLLTMAGAVGHATVRADAGTVRLEVRVFDGTVDVTAHTRVQVYPSGTRNAPVASPTRGERHIVDVLPGLYDVQAIVERDGRVVGIRWAERLAVMAYPDEAGDHLEVINLKSGFGALQVRGKDGAPVQGEATLYPGGTRDAAKKRAPAARTTVWMLFVVPAGSYDLVAGGEAGRQIEAIEIPADRTRLKFMP